MKFTFFFPYRNVSGVPLLFGNIANSLETNGYDVTIIDYMGGVLWNFCYDSVKKIEFIDGKLLTINPDSYLILQSGVLTDLRPEINFANNQKLVFYNYIQTITD